MIEAKNIYVYKNGKPISLQFGKVYKNKVVSYLINKNFHIYYNSECYKFPALDYIFNAEYYRNDNGNVIFRITKPLDINNNRASDLSVEFYNPENELKYIVNIFTMDKNTYWDYETNTNIPNGNWTVKIRDLDNTSYTYEDDFWKYSINSNININE